MKRDAEIVLELLKAKELKFLNDEFGITKEAISAMSDDDVSDMYDNLCDIEVDETIAADDENRDLSKRGKYAERLVTIIGNRLYSSDNDEYEDDED